MLGYIGAFVLGMIVMDLMWAFKLGIPQKMYRAFKNRNRVEDFAEEEF
jgi:hypothetical protein